MARDDSVVSVDGSLLAVLDVLGLRLCNLDLRFEFRGLRHARQVRPRRDTLADLDRQKLQHAVYTRADAQSFHLAPLEVIARPELFNFRLLRSELGL